KATKLWVTVCFSLLLNISCKKFLDVHASNQVLQEEMFKDGDGVRIAVNGVYKILSTTDLYGQNLSWDFISALGYNYEFYSLPYDQRDAAQFNWQAATTQGYTEKIWQRAFNALANCNNIIQEVEKKDTGFFAQKSNEKNMILGEMYGIRALIHFDLLRIFSPAPSTGYTGSTIPYVTAYPEYQPAPGKMGAILDKIIGDMTKAQSMLGVIDTLYLRNTMRYASNRIRNASAPGNLPQGDFFNYRAERMNYFAATALLARIYIYKGDYDNAYNNAKIIYTYNQKGWFPWMSSIYQGLISDPDYIYTKRPDEILLCFSNNKNYDNWDALLQTGNFFMTMNSNYMNKLFGADLDDYRLVGWFNRYGDNRYLTWSRPRGSSYDAQQVTQNQGPLLPVIRISEMFHIMIECQIHKGNIPDAVNLLNTVRINRGAKTKISSTIGANDLMNALVNDIVRETLTEGQTFFMFKRLNRNIFNGDVDRVMNPADWYAPLPLSETAYQLQN
ncbi:MAG TPA: RagB/SusD family nutrient uptake outer membrane protein, partial [Puia sp.]|nr:RagB/SusD family nutrient uptake outer membrane protein [Puia sp.]